MRLTNVPGFLYAEGLTAEVEGLGEIVVDVAYGGNFYAIVEPQKNFRDIADHTAGELIALVAPAARGAEREIPVRPSRTSRDQRAVAYPVDRCAGHRTARTRATRCSTATRPSTARPCGTGTSARMAQLAAKGKLTPRRRVLARIHHRLDLQGPGRGGGHRRGASAAIIPSIAGWARMTGYNTIFIDDRDPFAHGFVVK